MKDEREPRPTKQSANRWKMRLEAERYLAELQRHGFTVPVLRDGYLEIDGPAPARKYGA